MTETQSVDAWVDGLPTNHVINSLLERVHLESGTRKCDICQENGNDVTATSWCKDCSEAYCDLCVNMHKKLKFLSDHDLVKLTSDLPSHIFVPTESYPACTTHKNRKLELFCFDHEKPCCLTCMTVNHRKCEKVMTIDEAAENFRESAEISSLSSKLEELVTEYSGQIDCHQKASLEHAKEIQNARQTLGKVKEDMVHHIEKLYQKFDEELKVLEKSMAVENPSDKLEQRKSQMELSVRTLQTLKTKSSNATLFLEFYKIKVKEAENRKFIVDHKKTFKKENVQLVENEKTKSFCSQIKSLGELRKTSKLLQSDTQCIDLFSCTPKEALTVQESGSRFVDAVLLKSGHIVAIDATQNKIWTYNNKGALVTSSALSSDPWSITVTDDKEVAVTLRSARFIQLITFTSQTNKLSFGRTISVSDQPYRYGLDCAGDTLYISSAYKVHEVKLNGTVTKIVSSGISQCGKLYGVSSRNGLLYVGNHVGNETVTCFSPNRSVCHQQKFSSISHPLGLTTDFDGNVYVVGYASKNVIQLSPDFTRERELLSTKSCPMGINFSKYENKFILTHLDKISVFEMVPS